jgi:protein arginine kinase
MRAKAEGWKWMVLRSMRKPAWLAEDAPHGDVALSTRVRYMRNLRGFRFPHRADHDEQDRVARLIRQAAEDSGLGLECFRSLTSAERDYFVGCRLLSPDYLWAMPNRMLLVNEERTLSVMVNEEDHLRLQALTAGWSLGSANLLAKRALGAFEAHLRFAEDSDHGYLAASPYNSGAGRRLSAMFHLIGLAQSKRLPSMLKALTSRGISVRGLFGESSRAIGAFAQVSLLNGPEEEFIGACDYLIREERSARAEVGRDTLKEKANQAIEFATRSRLLSLADALRILGWLRWAASSSLAPCGYREVDEALTMLDLGHPTDADEASRDRAVMLRSLLGS